VELVYHGLDLTRFPGAAQRRPARDGRNPADPVTILSVCRLVEKKGMDVLLDALAQLPANLNWRLVHAGGGPLHAKLARQATKLGIAQRISWRGALAQDELLPEYRAADMFALACRIARDGDRDGLPNVLVEAQSQALACVATNVSAIPELIRDGVTGTLVPAESAEEFARALQALIVDPQRRAALGVAGRNRVVSEFSLEANLDHLAEKFGLRPAQQRPRRLASL
jgi:glycosyltransferase involved in cell wall biosynthesis